MSPAARVRWWPAVVALLLLAGCSTVGNAGSSAGTGASGQGGQRHGAGVTASPAYPMGLTVFPSDQRRTVPDLRGSTLAGTSLALSSLRGHLVVLNVWASWCEPCRTELPALATLAARTTPAGTRFVGLDEQDTISAATEFLHSIGADYPHFVDDNGLLLAQLAPWLPRAVPGSLVVDPDGRVAARVVGQVTAEQLEPLLAQFAGTR